MSDPGEFHYRLPRRLGAWRPGSHPATSLGTGQEFVSHASLYDRPDPRRLDLRASLRDIRGDWLVRVSRQRAAVPVQVIVDVSASMAFGSSRPKLRVVADFVEALGLSAFRVGDSLGMAAFDESERMDLFVPALRNRGMGARMASLLRDCAAGGSGASGLEQVAMRYAGRAGLIFLVSDFHWPLERLETTLDLLAHAYVVPMISWDPAETQPPAETGLLCVREVESRSQRTLWMRPKLRARWLEAVAQRRAELTERFARRGIRPFHLSRHFEGEAMSRYFLEATA
ncbi:MAG: MxaS protein [Gammaproteobacteria bacterium]